MMMEEDHKHAVGIVTDQKVGDKIGDSTPITQQSTVLSDAPQDRLIKGRAQHEVSAGDPIIAGVSISTAL